MSIDGPQDHLVFARLCKTTFEKCDLKSCLEALRKSADTSSGGSGQARKVFRHVENRANVRVSPLLRLEPRRRSQRSLFVNALAGCDFITPFRHSHKPKCALCGEPRCDWKHLFFQCAKRPGCAKAFVDAMTGTLLALSNENKNRSVSATAVHSIVLLQRLWVSKNFDAILEFAFGISCFENGKQCPLRYHKVLTPIIEVTAREIGRVYDSWMDAAAIQQ